MNIVSGSEQIHGTSEKPRVYSKTFMNETPTQDY